MSETSRREFVTLAAKLAAVPGAASFLSVWLKAGQTHEHRAGVNAPPEPDTLKNYTPKFLDAQEFAALESFTEILIPTDDTPGAREAHCAQFIDFVLANAGELPSLQKTWRAAMDTLKQIGFVQADPATKESLIAAMSEPERNRGAHHAGYSAYQLIKQQNTFAFYTSRAGMIEALDYRGNSFNATFPACTHPEHHRL